RSVLSWAERWKAAALRVPPARPPEEAALAADLAELRRLAANAEPDGGGHARWREQRALEERIRRRSWRRPASGAPPRPAALLPDRAARLGERTLVGLVDVDGERYAVTGHRNQFHHRQVGRTAGVTAELEALRFALRRIVRRHGSPASRAAAAAAARHAAGELDRTVFAPIRRWLGDGELVLVPIGALHAMPGTLRPSCRGRPVTVAPSASAWLAAVDRAPADPGCGWNVFVAGPALAHAEAEVRRLADQAAPAKLLTGPAAAVEEVLATLDGAALAHLAAHGVFRSDNPMFSHLRLGDGPLTIYDLERLPRPPGTVILSACDSGLSAVHPGEELMGLTAALLGLGTARVLGSVLPAQDEAALILMTDLYRRLGTGDGLAAALAGAQAAAGDQLDELAVTAAAFVCFGAG